MSMQPARIVIVDDDELDRVVLRRMLEKGRLHNELVELTTGAEFIEWIENQRQAGAPMPDLVLLDLYMPQMSGHDILRWIREDEELRKISVVMLTVSEDTSDIRQSYLNGVTTYLTKPVKLNDLASVVARSDELGFQVVRKTAAVD